MTSLESQNTAMPTLKFMWWKTLSPFLNCPTLNQKSCAALCRGGLVALAMLTRWQVCKWSVQLLSRLVGESRLTCDPVLCLHMCFHTSFEIQSHDLSITRPVYLPGLLDWPRQTVPLGFHPGVMFTLALGHVQARVKWRNIGLWQGKS